MVQSGDHAPLFNLPDQDGQRTILRDKVGTPIVLAFYASDSLEACQGVTLALKDRFSELEALGAKVYSISADAPDKRKAFAGQHELPFPLLSDPDFQVTRQYGALKIQEGDRGNVSVTRTFVLLDRNIRILKVYAPVIDAETQVQELISDIRTLCPEREPRIITSQAPVLLIPNVISREFARQLINIWEREGNEDSGFMRRDGEKTVGVLDYDMKIRRDHFVKDDGLRRHLDRLMLDRVVPEIKKCFNYDVTCCENYKIACYDSEPGGYFRQHRDNTTGGTAHRVWAMTLNLNAEEYDGGCLKFSEYGPDLYKPATGDAVIFSCSMMHEATPVENGRRFVLLAFFYGEKESQSRRAYEDKHGTDSYKPVPLR